MNKNLDERIYRVVDANLNRLKEGLRVVEDIRRYVFDDKALSIKIKILRHKANIDSSEFIKFRDSINDVLKPSISNELTRIDLQDIQIANIKRAQESARVLEECFKLIKIEYSEIFKSIRYELYAIEKEI
ncbi:thiamine-phosphate pyrophosphorylase [Campylobacter sp. RM16192]|uniref:thiamine-phosphate pyrophosphorylase n=1 Tax=Campylobacter sp. RM16192 TaxID=1660080 RepID=UPI001452A2BF|nr:thiamine-phosphate pyrophosphorylase [Campylobacter sp. RM16192]QCD51775.1 thiamine phosphate synthase [Campylobacter sp. RM16192]